MNRSLSSHGFYLNNTRTIVASNLRLSLSKMLENSFDKENFLRLLDILCKELQSPTPSIPETSKLIFRLKNDLEKTEQLVTNLSEACIFLAENCVELLVGNSIFF
jgi:hypothetical protein